MNPYNHIQVFEFETLHVGHNGFEQEHFDALTKYNDKYGGKFFNLGHRSIRFQHFVGVIQANDLTIEILPKIGKSTNIVNEKDCWQRVVIEMLRECNWMKVHANEKAFLQYRYNSILEAYLDLFINELETLIHQGLIKKYRQKDGNLLALKGKLLFSRHIQQNITHEERFFIRHQIYDHNHPFNQVLLKALKLIPSICNSPALNDRVYNLLFSFPELEDLNVTTQTFEKLIFDRKSEAYREAIGIAAMILLNHRPDVMSGTNHILAILFDMNDLWEEFVARQIMRFNSHKWNIISQEEKPVWEKALKPFSRKKIRPDLVISAGGKKLILDTKWKLPEDNTPSDSDLKQMFLYNEYWEEADSVLVYPKISGQLEYEEGQFLNGDKVQEGERSYRHICGIMKVSVLNDQNLLAENLGEQINNRIKTEFFRND